MLIIRMTRPHLELAMAHTLLFQCLVSNVKEFDVARAAWHFHRFEANTYHNMWAMIAGSWHPVKKHCRAPVRATCRPSKPKFMRRQQIGEIGKHGDEKLFQSSKTNLRCAVWDKTYKSCTRTKYC